MAHKTSISYIGKSDMGCVRKNNEDAYVACRLWDDKSYLVVAIDGVGGYEGGEVAAAIASKTIPEFLLASSNGERLELLKQAVTAANNAIFEARISDPDRGHMSCVLTAALIDVAQKQISMAHVGDSRMYGFHNGELKKLSHDHSLIGYREEIGDLTEEEAMHHPQRNIIGRDVGSAKHKANDEDFIEAQVFPLLPNTTLLLCSDGLTDMIPSNMISAILGAGLKLENKADTLIQSALNAGGKDNVTVVLFEYLSDEKENPDVKSTLDTPSPVKAENDITASDGESESVKDVNYKKSFLRGKLPYILLALLGIMTGLCLYSNYRCGKVRSEKASLERALDTLRHQNDSLTMKLGEIEGVSEQLGKEVDALLEIIHK